MNLHPLVVIGALLLGVLLVVIVLAIAWIASGESDVNGDPERDSGMDDDEIERRNRAWDRGSAETESRPNLEYARRMNRESMRHILNH